jgi:hypothetical protein
MLFIIGRRRRTTDMPSVEGVDDNVPPTGYGVRGRSSGYGVYGLSSSSDGVHGQSGSGYGVAAYSETNYAAYLEGNVRVTGTLQKGGGRFTIDHPLDPANKYLSHSFVESPDMKNGQEGIESFF